MTLSPSRFENRSEIIARPGAYYRRARYAIVAIVLACGLWFAYDGWINWPREVELYNNLPHEQQIKRVIPHTNLDIAIQRYLAVALTPLSPALLALFLYLSRGQYRLKDQTLYVPGHPPVDFSAIQAIDKSLWARKGIAYVEYQLPGKPVNWLKLDDFVYNQEATDAIVTRIERFLTLIATEHAEAEMTADEAGDASTAEPS